MLLVCCRSSSLSYPNGIPLAKPFPMGISVSLRISWLKVECLSVAWVALLRRSFIYYTYNHKLLFTVLKHIRHTYTPAGTDIYFFFAVVCAACVLANISSSFFAACILCCIATQVWLKFHAWHLCRTHTRTIPWDAIQFIARVVRIWSSLMRRIGRAGHAYADRCRHYNPSRLEITGFRGVICHFHVSHIAMYIILYYMYIGFMVYLPPDAVPWILRTPMHWDMYSKGRLSELSLLLLLLPALWLITY